LKREPTERGYCASPDKIPINRGTNAKVRKGERTERKRETLQGHLAAAERN